MNKPALPFFLHKLSTQKSSGQSIIEIILAIGIAALVITALIVLGSVSLRNSLSSARRNEATKLAVSGLEAMRFRRDSQGFSTLSVGCHQINADGSVTNIDTTCTADDGWVEIDLLESTSRSIFERKIEVELYGDTAEQDRMRKVSSSVKWAEGASNDPDEGGERTVVMSVVLSEWE